MRQTLTFLELRSNMSWAGLSAAHTSSRTSPDVRNLLKSSALYRLLGLWDKLLLLRIPRAQIAAHLAVECYLKQFVRALKFEQISPSCVEVGNAALESVVSQEHASAACVGYGGAAALDLTLVFIINNHLNPVWKNTCITCLSFGPTFVFLLRTFFLQCLKRSCLQKFSLPSGRLGHGHIMPQVIVILFVWFPHFVVETEDHVAVFQTNVHPVCLESVRRESVKTRPGWNIAGDVPKGNVAADLLFVLQDETLTLRALEPEGDVNLIAQAEIRELRRQRASKAELCSTGDLDSDRMVSVGQVGLGVIWAKRYAAQKWMVLPGTLWDSLCWRPLARQQFCSRSRVSDFSNILYMAAWWCYFWRKGNSIKVVKNGMDNQSRGCKRM